jgi:hypothetical protein
VRINVSIGFISSCTRSHTYMDGFHLSMYVCAVSQCKLSYLFSGPAGILALSLFRRSLNISHSGSRVLLMKKCVCFNARHACGHLSICPAARFVRKRETRREERRTSLVNLLPSRCNPRTQLLICAVHVRALCTSCMLATHF